jgi:hypothetical protein
MFTEISNFLKEGEMLRINILKKGETCRKCFIVKSC